jgi:hypothetical protein
MPRPWRVWDTFEKDAADLFSFVRHAEQNVAGLAVVLQPVIGEVLLQVIDKFSLEVQAFNLRSGAS